MFLLVCLRAYTGRVDHGVNTHISLAYVYACVEYVCIYIYIHTCVSFLKKIEEGVYGTICVHACMNTWV